MIQWMCVRKEHVMTTLAIKEQRINIMLEKTVVNRIKQLAAEKKSSGKKPAAKDPELAVKPSGKAQVKQNGIEAFADDFEDIEE